MRATILLFAMLISSSATAQFDHCDRDDAVCVGKVLLQIMNAGNGEFSGIKTNLPESTLGQWTQCYSGAYNESFPVSRIAACGGTKLLIGCKRQGESNLRVAAMGDAAQICQESSGTVINGVKFYFSTNRSIGFAPANAGVSLSSCDTASGSDDLRMCWHTSGNNVTGGYRCGDATSLNSSSDWIRVVYTK